MRETTSQTTTGDTAASDTTGERSVRPLGTAVLVRAVLAAVAAEIAGAVLAGGVRLARLARCGAVGAARLVRAHWYRVCGAVLVAAVVVGLVAMLAAPLLIAVTGAR